MPAPSSDQPSAASGEHDASREKADFQDGVAALRKGDAQAAADIFESLVDSRPEWAGAYANLGTARMLQGRAAAARAAYERAVQLDSGLATAWLRLGVLYRRDGDFAQAETAYKAALKARPDDRYAHLNLAILYDVYLHRPQLALEHYQRFQALSGQPEDTVALWIMDLKQQLSSP